MTLEFKLGFYNDKWNLHIKPQDQEVELQETDLRTVDAEGGQFRLRAYKIEDLPFPLYKFGIMLDDVKKRPGHGGEWSSCAGVINPIFNTSFVEIGFAGRVVAIDKSDLEQYCPEIECREVIVDDEHLYEITLPHYQDLGRQSFNFLHTV